MKKIIEAAKNGDYEQLRLLIKQSENSNDYNKALEYASKNGHTECVKLLIPVSDTKNCNALSWASICGHTECVKLLIPVSDPKANNSEALIWAGENNNNDCVELLLPHSDISAWSKEEWRNIDPDVQNIILSYYSKISLEQNVLSNNDRNLKPKKIHKL